MTNNLATIRDALVTACATEALAALAEMERAAAEPVAWMWEDMLGISHAYVSPKRPTWPDAGASPEMAVAINVRPLYAAPPTPAAEIREVEVTDEMCNRAYISKWRGVPELIDHEPDDEDRQWAREWLSAWRAELGPALGLVELKEPTPEELKRIAAEYQSRQHFADTCIWRDMYDAVRAVLWPKEGL